MDIFDEQAPFTKEQADYLATHYVRKTVVRSDRDPVALLRNSYIFSRSYCIPRNCQSRSAYRIDDK